jgi:hypothetical protein
MPQVFHRSFNVLSKLSIYGAVFLLAGLGGAAALWARSSYTTNVGITRSQPIPFSHQHHVFDLGIDCRYCHTSVEDSSFAGIPPTKTCMNCHSEIWVGADMLAPVRESYRSDRSIEWNRVHNLADFCYFNHSIHVAKGVGCVTCHGRIDHMPLVRQQNTLLMEWCLDCHRDPAKNVRPREQVFNMTWEPSQELQKDWLPDVSDETKRMDQATLGRILLERYDIQSKMSCSTCHR